MILIGSLALRYHYDDYFAFPNDVDLIGTEKEFFDWISTLNLKEDPNRNEYENLVVYNFKLNGINYEYEVAENENSATDYLAYCLNKEGDFEIAPVDVLFSIKRSHIHKEINFRKHILDFHFLKRKKIEFNDQLDKITKKRKEETDIRLKSRFPNLNKSYDDFVKESQDVLKRIYDHDDLHRIVAHYDKPLYMSLQEEDNDKVWCKKDYWNQFSFEDKIKCVLEETYVITLERQIIPMLFQGKGLVSKQKATEWALIRTATALSSGWFSDFIIDNFFEIKKNINYSFIDNFFDELERGNVKHYIDSSV